MENLQKLGVKARDGGEGNGACRCVLGRDDEHLVDSATLSLFLSSALGFEYLEANHGTPRAHHQYQYGLGSQFTSTTS